MWADPYYRTVRKMFTNNFHIQLWPVSVGFEGQTFRLQPMPWFKETVCSYTAVRNMIEQGPSGTMEILWYPKLNAGIVLWKFKMQNNFWHMLNFRAGTQNTCRCPFEYLLVVRLSFQHAAVHRRLHKKYKLSWEYRNLYFTLEIRFYKYEFSQQRRK